MKRYRRREATPVAHMILSKRMADHKPHDMVCELVDNALDAGAEHVWIELGRRSVVVADDGSAMEDISDAIRFGKGTRAGRRGGVPFELARARHRVRSKCRRRAGRRNGLVESSDPSRSHVVG